MSQMESLPTLHLYACMAKLDGFWTCLCGLTGIDGIFDQCVTSISKKDGIYDLWVFELQWHVWNGKACPKCYGI